MDSTRLPSLEHLIRTKIQRRIFVAMFILVAGAIFTSVIEAALSYSDLVARLEQRASTLQDQIISEVLVNNRDATAAILNEANRDTPNEAVKWIPPEQSTISLPAEALHWSMSGQWTFNRPLKTLGEQRFGEFIFTGNFFTNGSLVSTLSHRVAYALAICIVMGFLLLPIARKIPSDLILQPVYHLLDLVRSERDESLPRENAKYLEIQALEGEFESLMTKKKHLEDERVEMEQVVALTRTAQMLAHDIRRPFALIKATLDGLAKSMTPEDVRHLTESNVPGIQRSLEGLDTMLDELIMLGRPRSVSLDKVDLNEIILRGIEIAVASNKVATSKIKTNTSEGIFVRGDSNHLQRVITNLVANAIQAMGTDDSMTIEAKTLNSSVEIRVQNTGSYIPPSEQTKIFHPFYTKGKANGTGLGLAFCKRTVTDHGGTIRVESSKDDGTEFIVTLPIYNVAESLEATSTVPLKLSSSEESLRVLVADDEIFYREAVVSLTNEASPSIAIQVVQATTGEEAIQIAMNTNSQVVIIDIDFGQSGINGLEAVREMRRRGLEATICVHSNNTLQSTRAAALEAGANIFVPKPMSAESLEAVLSATRA